MTLQWFQRQARVHFTGGSVLPCFNSPPPFSQMSESCELYDQLPHQCSGGAKHWIVIQGSKVLKCPSSEYWCVVRCVRGDSVYCLWHIQKGVVVAVAGHTLGLSRIFWWVSAYYYYYQQQSLILEFVCPTTYYTRNHRLDIPKYSTFYAFNIIQESLTSIYTALQFG